MALRRRRCHRGRRPLRPAPDNQTRSKGRREGVDNAVEAHINALG